MNTPVPQSAPEVEPHVGSIIDRNVRPMVRRSKLFQRLVQSDSVMTAVNTLMVVSKVNKPWRFLKDQLSKGESSVTFRATGTEVFVRSRSKDMVMLQQILGSDDMYEPPAPVAEVLGKLPKPIRVADLGANIGLFSAAVLNRHPTSEILAIEADPENSELFKRTIRANGWEERISLMEAAASVAAGPIFFSGGNHYNSRVEETAQASTLTIPGIDILPLLADRDFIKIDIEGSEWPILDDPRFLELGAVAIAMEWHRYQCPDEDPVAYVDGILKSAGFKLEHDETSPDCGTLWAWRE